MQKIKILLIIIIIINSSLYGQSRKITFIIDTLVIENENNFEIAITRNNSFLTCFGEYIEDSLYNRQYNKYPNLYCSIILKSDSSSIQFSLDNNNGYVNLINVYSSNFDTIRLNKHIVYDNCYNDTVYTTTTYYHKRINEPLGKPYKIKHNKSITKKSCKNKPPLNTQYVINNKNYEAAFQKEIEGGINISDCHGYQPNKYNLSPETFKGKVTYFHSHSESKFYISVINLQIKKDL